MHGNPLITASTYIPHEESDNNTRDRIWEELNEHIRSIPEAVNIIIVGDLNTSIHARKEEEEDYIGPNILGKGIEFLRQKEHNTPEDKTTNRDHLIMLLKANDMKVMNTYFYKESK